MFLYRIFLYLIGMFINFLGVTLIVKSALGAGVWSAFFVSISDVMGMTVGFWYGAFQVFFIFVNAQLLGIRPDWGAVIPLILEAVIFDFWLEVVFHSLYLHNATLLTKLSVFLLGITLLGLGVAVYILPGFSKAPIDQLFLSISEKFQWSVRKSQTALAVVVFGIATLLKGPVGLGTVIATLLMGPMIQFWQGKVQNWYNPSTSIREVFLGPEHAHHIIEE
ncbi:YczE/YyaS/YitT family protein [Salirhabdus salicampi]|uniref:YczE/YyaS/YitT family protein n=1 Tax=Salirhabdus salicampi TaxID=476102 RepID=UPI0020C5037F|nr:hypothetical protein [Salirhabdus salicampi]MCP8616250.1 hypothetical protein [Salirhabdus salicampi]